MTVREQRMICGTGRAGVPAEPRPCPRRREQAVAIRFPDVTHRRPGGSIPEPVWSSTSSSTGREPFPLAGRRLAVVDVDANGQDPPEIVDLAVLPLDGAGPGAPVGPSSLLSWLVRPARPITAAVTREVHGIRNSEVFVCPAWHRVAPAIHDVLCDRVLVAHGAAEHLRMLAAHLPGWRPPLVLDTARLARSVWPRLSGGYGLDRLVTHAGLVAPAAQPGRRRHRAGYDAWMTGQLLLTIVQRASLTWEQLVRAAAVLPHEPRDAALP